jgi:lipopolysaccharide transport system ATP-binding protein
MSDTAIRVENLSKQYKIGVAKSRHDTLRDKLAENFKSLFHCNGRNSSVSSLASSASSHPSARNNTIWALKDVSFQIGQGDVVGIIGPNGAGKSTLLKILSRITEPTSGRAEIYGRVGSLLEVGTGFHPELTGRENIYLNGTILGMTRMEIDRKFDEIVFFAEIEKFIDTPVKRYSSGMYVRLAFAVAAHLETEILVVDEALSVGDVTFQKKCLARMREFADGGKTVIFVSHSIETIQELCRRAMLILSGRLTEEGPTQRVVEEYLKIASWSEDGNFDLSDHAARWPGYVPIIRRLTLLSQKGIPTTRFSPDDALVAEMTIKPSMSIRDPRIALGIEDSLGRRITTVASFFQQQRIEQIDGSCLIRCTLSRLALGSGRYLISLCIWNKNDVLDVLQNAASFEVNWQDNYGNGEPYRPIYGPVLTNSTWEKLG